MSGPHSDTMHNEEERSAPEINEEDLEDGEIDDSDEEVEKNAEEDAKTAKTSTETTHLVSNSNHKSNKMSDNISDVMTVSNHQQNLSKSKKSQAVDDDFVGSIEHAIANALKKKGIEPTMPKILEGKLQQQNNENSDESVTPGPGQGQSKSSRRRKRKKQREEKEKEKEKDKERSEKRKRYDTSDALGPPSFGDEMDMDEFEMMNVRGGSPPPLTALHPPLPVRMFDDYDSRDDSASSYDSYESNDENSNGERRKRRSKRDSRRRKDNKRSDDKRNEKRSRRESLDEKHRNEPRKMELCKFYLMECCAKRDKCSYMHAEFPCKYYYLGMECTAKEDCKFAHGEPLTEELRNILLKHLESAPKEILGNFKRMSRENALNRVIKRHEELCRKFNAQNVWAPVTASTLPISNNRRNNNSNSNMNNSNNNHPKKDTEMQQHNSTIPSLLDLVVNPPQHMDSNASNKLLNNETKRKSRWTDSSNACTSTNALNIQPPSKTAPSYLDLKNLTGILSEEHIDKLSQMGIVNLEQVNQLTFGQLNQIGLTIAEITEIQLNAINMAKLGVTGGDGSGISKGSPSNKGTGATSPKGQDVCKASSNGDVDMRFLPAAPSSTATELPEKDNTTSSNSNSSSGVVMVDYSQYLKDSNISFDKGDLYDDEKDDEQLVIDDGNLETEDPSQKQIANENASSDPSEKLNSENFDNVFATKLPRNMSDISKTFRNPFKSSGFYGADTKTSEAASDPCSSGRKPKVDMAFGEESHEDEYCPNKRYSRDSRSRSRTPPPGSQSNTPEASQSPQPFDRLRDDTSPVKDVVYERSTIYDFSSTDLDKDSKASLRLKSDKDMRFLPGSLMGETSSGDIDLRLPFQPMTNYTPATEIDGSITSHLPINYKVNVVDVPRPNYAELRNQFKSDHTADPRLRRILGLPELSPSKTSTALSRKVRKSSSNSIASPSETEDSSPRYYTPTSSDEKHKGSSRIDPRTDPRDSRSTDPRVGDPRQSESRSSDPRQSSDPRRNDPRSAGGSNSANNSNSSGSSAASTNPTGGQKQNVEIRNLLQKSEWYKNLNSKFKIMVNQQLALVSTELKKFHQDQSPNKIFDISFIVNNQTLQQILTNLGIYIDDNGDVAHIDGEGDGDGEADEGIKDGPSPIQGVSKPNITLPNLSQPPPSAGSNQRNQNNSSMDFLLAPPPNMVPPQGPPPPIALGPMFQRPSMQVPPFARPSLLGLPPGQGNPMNPFNNPMPNMNVNINPNFLAGGPPGILGPFTGALNFGGPGGNMQMQQQQRNFNNNQRNNNRIQNKRRI